MKLLLLAGCATLLPAILAVQREELASWGLQVVPAEDLLPASRTRRPQPQAAVCRHTPPRMKKGDAHYIDTWTLDGCLLNIELLAACICIHAQYLMVVPSFDRTASRMEKRIRRRMKSLPPAILVVRREEPPHWGLQVVPNEDLAARIVDSSSAAGRRVPATHLHA
ncbi:hypothetical protein Dimus_001897 [Dionaea muscipula]